MRRRADKLAVAYRAAARRHGLKTPTYIRVELETSDGLFDDPLRDRRREGADYAEPAGQAERDLVADAAGAAGCAVGGGPRPAGTRGSCAGPGGRSRPGMTSRRRR